MADSPDNNSPSHKFTVPYCGIHSLYAASLAEGVDLPFDKLLLGKYVGCNLGSTLAELEQAATDNGMYAIPAANLSLDVLKRSQYPVILHVRGSITETRRNLSNNIPVEQSGHRPTIGQTSPLDTIN